MNNYIFQQEKFIEDVSKALSDDDKSLSDVLESITVKSALPFIFNTIGWRNCPMGLFVSACEECNLRIEDYFVRSEE